MSQQAKALEKAGWKFHSARKRGMFKMVYWIDPKPMSETSKSHAIQPQAFAYAIMRSRRVTPCAANVAGLPDRSDTGDCIAVAVADSSTML